MEWLVKEVPLGLHIQNMKWRFPSGKGELQQFPQESMKLSRGIEEDKNPKYNRCPGMQAEADGNWNQTNLDGMILLRLK